MSPSLYLSNAHDCRTDPPAPALRALAPPHFRVARPADLGQMDGVMTANESSSDGERPFGQSPFAALSLPGLPPGPTGPAAEGPAPAATRKNRGRVDVQRQKAGRGGKTVTVVSGFLGIGLNEKQKLAQTMQKACGTGGTVKEGRIEIQGDQREAVARLLAEAGFRPVFTGG